MSTDKTFNEKKSEYILNQVKLSEHIPAAIAFVDALELSGDECLLLEQVTYGGRDHNWMNIHFCDTEVCPMRTEMLPVTETKEEAKALFDAVLDVLFLEHEYAQQCFSKVLNKYLDEKRGGIDGRE